MYPQYGDGRYPQEFTSGQGQMIMDPAASQGRYPYPVYYGPKGPEGAQIGGIATSSRGQQFSGKSRTMMTAEGTYGQNWGSMGMQYVPSQGGKQTMGKHDYPYPGQMDMYAGRVPPTPQAYLDQAGVPAYTPAPPYSAPQYPAQYPYSFSKSMLSSGMPPGGMGGMVVEGYPADNMRGQMMVGGVPPYSTSGSWSGRLSGSVPSGGGGGGGRGWPHDPNGDGSGSPPWASPVPPTGSHSSTSAQQQQQGQQQTPPQPPYRQLSQPSVGAMSPQTPYSGDLQKHSSVSSLRDALMISSTGGNPSPLNPYNNPQMQTPTHLYAGPGLVNNPSPITPSVHRPHTPDASTPAGTSSVMSPSLKPGFPERQDVLPNDSELAKSYSKPGSTDARGQDSLNNFGLHTASPYQVESLLAGNKSEKANGSEGSLSSPISGQVTPYGESLNFGSLEEGKETFGNTEYSNQGRCVPPSPKGQVIGGVDSAAADVRRSVLSHVERNHPSIVHQYTFSDETQRKEFLDSLFSFLEREGISLVQPPIFGKAPLDLYKMFCSVQQLGGFLRVTEKFLWDEVVKSLSPVLSSSAVKGVQQCYLKMVLPFECQLKGLDMNECLQCFKSAMRYYAARMGQKNHPVGTPGDARESFDAAEKMNGDALSSQEQQQVELHRRLSQRTSSQDSDTSGFHGEGHELTHTVSHNPERPGTHQQGRRKQEGYEFAEGMSQSSVDDEPLPDIGVQETESLLGMQYMTPMVGAGPGTPGGQNTPSPSPYTPQYQSAPRGDWSGTDIVPNADVSELGILPGHPPPAYPPAYPMDPTMAMYRMSSHPGMMMPGYSPYGMPPPQVVPNDYALMRGSYPGGGGGGGGGPYPGMMPGMDPASSYSQQHYMMQQQQMAAYRHGMEMGYPGHAIPPEWQQQWRHHGRVTSIPPHMQAQYQRTVQPSTSPRPSHPQGSASMPSGGVSVAQQQQQLQQGSSPHPPDAMRMHWQDQQSQGQMKASSVKVSGSSSPKPKLEVPSSGAKGLPAKSVEMQAAAIDSMRRPLPDWSGCVEGTKPHLVKRRRLFSGDCGHVEPWRVMMSLKSGILSESTWALDTLTILLHDDRTVGFFYLKHHHSLLHTLVDHFKQCLIAIFGDHFESLAKYYPHSEGKDVVWAPQTDKGSDSAVATDWLLGASMTDHAILSKRNGLSAFRKGSAKNRTFANSCVTKEDEELEQAVPLAGVFNGSSDAALGRSDNLSHIEVSFTCDDPSFFPETKGSPSFEFECLGSQVERNRKRQRVDETPLAELLRRSILSDYNAQLSHARRTVRSPKKAGGDEQQGHLKENGEPVGEVKEEAGTTVDRGRLNQSDLEVKKKQLVIIEEGEIYQKELLPLWTISPSNEFIQARCLCVSNILRSLSFIPGNDLEFSQHPGILLILGRLLLLHHHHLTRPTCQLRDYVHEEKPEEPVPHRNHWWWDCLDVLQENTLVILSNVAGQLDLSIYPESISYPIVDGLMHWMVCPSSRSVDPLPDFAMVTSLSPQKLVLETLAKMSILESNVNFILATPPLSRLDLIFTNLVQWFGQKKLPVVRQFALVLLANLAQGDESLGQMIGEQRMTVSLLLECLEAAEQTACTSGGQLVGGYNPDDPNSLSIAMLRRAATLLHCLSKVPSNRTAFLPFRDRLLYLSTSEYVEPSISSILMDMLFELGKL